MTDSVKSEFQDDVFRTSAQEIDDSDTGPEDKAAWDIALGALYRIRRNYEDADPNEYCDSYRLELAHQSIRCFWNVFRYYMPWVPHFIIGRYLLQEEPELSDFVASRMGKERPDEDYVFEDVGACFGCNNFRTPIKGFSDDIETFLYENEHIGPSNSMRRRLFIDMCMTTIADAWWAKDVQGAFEALEAGDTLGLLLPDRKIGGNGVILQNAKINAICMVNYLHGKGARKLDARTEVSDELDVSVSTVRYWEASLQKDEYTEYIFFCSYLAGFYEDEISIPARNRSPEQQEALDAIEPRSFKFMDTIYMAELKLKALKSTSYEGLRSELDAGKEA